MLQVFLKHSRSILAAIPPHHKEAYAIARTATAAVRGCGGYFVFRVCGCGREINPLALQVEEICLRHLPNRLGSLANSPLLSPAAVGVVRFTSRLPLLEPVLYLDYSLPAGGGHVCVPAVAPERAPQGTRPALC